jgi:hypothetical protein
MKGRGRGVFERWRARKQRHCSHAGRRQRPSECSGVLAQIFKFLFFARFALWTFIFALLGLAWCCLLKSRVGIRHDWRMAQTTVAYVLLWQEGRGNSSLVSRKTRLEGLFCTIPLISGAFLPSIASQVALRIARNPTIVLRYSSTT